MIVCKVQIWYSLQGTYGRVTVCKIWVCMQLERIGIYMVLTCMAYGCMTIRMRMHELKEKRERVMEAFLGAIERDERIKREFEIGEEAES